MICRDYYDEDLDFDDSDWLKVFDGGFKNGKKNGKGKSYRRDPLYFGKLVDVGHYVDGKL